MNTYSPAVWIGLLCASISPAIALAPQECFEDKFSCEGTCGSSSKSCRETSQRSPNGIYTVTVWQEVDRLCATFSVTQPYQCDDVDLGDGWAPVTGCELSAGMCCKGTIESRDWSLEGKVWIPLHTTGCIQPGDPG